MTFPISEIMRAKRGGGYPKLKIVFGGRGVIKCALHVGTENTIGWDPMMLVDEPPEHVAQPCTMFLP